MLSKKICIVLLIVITILIVVALFLGHPIPQSQRYHIFADQRVAFGVVNGANVLSNILFVLIGGWGVLLFLSKSRVAFVHTSERWPFFAMAVGLVLTGIGSAYYHLHPDNARLVWDRLPMMIVFMSLLAALIQDRLSVRGGLILWPILIAIGIYSVLQWYWSEANGHGDLRLYILLQGLAIILSCLLLLQPSQYTRRWDLILIIAFYVLAKLFELWDWQIFNGLGGYLSGHTLKHIAAAVAGFFIVRMAWKRKIIRN